MFLMISTFTLLYWLNPGPRGTFYVLEDNPELRRGVSYMIENRENYQTDFFGPQFPKNHVRPVTQYPHLVQESDGLLGQVFLSNVYPYSPEFTIRAYFEHTTWAIGWVWTVEAGLEWTNQKVYMKTTQAQQVDVIYRGWTMIILDPLVFNRESF